MSLSPTTAPLVLPAASTRARIVSAGHMERQVGLVLRVGSSEYSGGVIDKLLHVIGELPVDGRRKKQFVQHKSDDSDDNDTDTKPSITCNDCDQQKDHPEFS